MIDQLLVNGRPIPYDTVPVAHMAGGMRRYFENGISPGSFGKALLSNDLCETLARADDDNAACVRQWVQWLYNNAPAGSWGSPANYANWITRRQGDLLGDGGVK